MASQSSGVDYLPRTHNRKGRTVKARKKRQPYKPPTEWDTGPATQAAQYMKIVEEAAETDPSTGKKVNPNGIKRTRRISVAEWYVRRGHLTKKQGDTAAKLLKAWERNHRSPPAIKEIQVDTSPKPDAHIAITIDRISKYHRIARSVPKKYQAYVFHVARDDRFLNAMPGYRSNVFMDRLKAGLDILADKLDS